jgi:hypothetical protein
MDISRPPFNELLSPRLGCFLLLPIVAHVQPSLRTEIRALCSMTLSAVIPAVLLVLSDRKEPSLAFHTTADAMDYGKVLNQEGNGNDLRVSAATSEEQVVPGH